MTTRDTPEAIVGAALLCVCAKNRWTIIGEPGGPLRSYEEFAAAALAALDGWTLVPTAVIERAATVIISTTPALAHRSADSPNAEALRLNLLLEEAANDSYHDLRAALAEGDGR